MRSVRLVHLTLLSSSIALSPWTAPAQGTAADYARAEGLRGRIEGLVVDAAEAPTWVGAGSNQFVYRKSVTGGFNFMLVDAVTLEKRPAFDHDRLAVAITTVIRRPAGPPITSTTLPLGRLTLVDRGRAIEFVPTGRPGEPVTDTTRWRCTLADYMCARAPAREDSLRARRQVGGGLFGTPPAPAGVMKRPGAVELPRRFRMYRVTDDAIYGAARDDDGVERIVKLGLMVSRSSAN